MNTSSDKFRQNTLRLRKLMPATGVFLCCLCYAAFLADKTMPISEGWYTEYAHLINSGLIPYRDFAYLMPPAYLYTISWITALFGYDIIVLRIVGALIFALIAVLAYIMFCNVFSKLVAVPSALACMFFMQSGVGEIFYDYIYFCNLFVYTAIACIVYYISNTMTSGQSRHRAPDGVLAILALVCGLSTSLACLTKQSTGLMLFAGITVFIIGVGACFGLSKPLRRFIPLFFIGFILPILSTCAFLYANGAFSQFIDNCISSAVSAKGGLGEELFSWIYEGETNFRLYSPLAIAALLCAGIGVMCGREKESNVAERLSPVFPITAVLFSLLIPWICYEWETLSRAVAKHYDTMAPLYSSALVPILVLILLSGKAISSRIHSRANMDANYLPLLALCAAATSIVWAVGMSGGLGESQVCLGTGIGLGLVLQAFQGTRHSLTVWMISVLSLSVLTCGGVSRKYCEMYNWWGLSEGSIWDQTETVDIPLLQGIHMSKRDADCYRAVYEAAEGLVLERGDMFAFPHCPIFYCIAGGQPGTYSIVQWFDVSSKETIEADIEVLASQPPAILILCEIPETTMAGHEAAFNTYQTREMQSYLFDLANNHYTSVAQCDMGNGYIVHIFSLCRE